MAFDAFLKIDGIKGESTDAVKKDWIEILSFSFGASNPSAHGSGTGGHGAGRVSVSSFNVMKKTDSASAKLFQSCCTGHHHASAQVYLRKAGGNDVKQGDFLTYDFKDVSIDSVQWSGASGGEGVPTESLSFSFDQVKIKYFPQDAKGKLATTPVQAGWDLSKNVAV